MCPTASGNSTAPAVLGLGAGSSCPHSESTEGCCRWAPGCPQPRGKVGGEKGARGGLAADGQCLRAPGPATLSLPSGTYNLECYSCAVINSFNCEMLRECPYETRRCMTVSIRKCLLVCLRVGGQSHPPPGPARSRGQSGLLSLRAPCPWPALSPLESVLLGSGPHPGESG